jgi:hypothetical protein
MCSSGSIVACQACRAWICGNGLGSAPRADEGHQQKTSAWLTAESPFLPSLLLAEQVLALSAARALCSRQGVHSQLCVMHCPQGGEEAPGCPQGNIKVRECTSCSACKDCRHPLPLVIPEGADSTGCSAEVAAVAEALHAASISKATSSSRASTAGVPSRGEGDTGAVGDDGGRSTSGDGNAGASAATAPSNPVFVECAVCHRRPGDPGVPATLKLCGGCHMARYCSTECQSARC